MTDPKPDPTPDPPKDDPIPDPPKPDPIPDPPVDPPDAPEWVAMLAEKIDGLAAVVGTMAPPISDPNPDPLDPALPDDGKELTDESPAKQPWTHRKFF